MEVFNFDFTVFVHNFKIVFNQLIKPHQNLTMYSAVGVINMKGTERYSSTNSDERVPLIASRYFDVILTIACVYLLV